MEYLDDHGEVIRRDSTDTLRDAYLRYCTDSGFEPAELEG
jgi:hypothetical protein